MDLIYSIQKFAIYIGGNTYENKESPCGVSAEKYYTIYSMLIKEIKDALPDIKIIIFEPFVLKAAATEEN